MPSPLQKKNIRNLQNWKNQWEGFLFSDAPAATATKVLLTLALGSVVIVGATMPGLFKMIDSLARKRCSVNRYSKKKIENSLVYLKKKKWLEIVSEKNGRVRVRLTNKGRKRLSEYSLDAIRIKKPKKWDGKWRVLMFDIPAYPKRYNHAREALRNKIKDLGFFQIQKSVWAYPYDCEDEILFITEMFGVQTYVELLIVEKFLHEDSLVKNFPGLKK